MQRWTGTILVATLVSVWTGISRHEAPRSDLTKDLIDRKNEGQRD